MSRFAQLAAAGLLVALTAACSSPPAEETGDATDGATETVEAPADGAPDGAAADAPAASAEFDSPLVPGRKPGVPEMSRLIAPTDLQARTQQAEARQSRQRSSRDPFSVPIQVRPSVQVQRREGATNQPSAQDRLELPRAVVRQVAQGDRATTPPSLSDPSPPRAAATGGSRASASSSRTGSGGTAASSRSSRAAQSQTSGGSSSTARAQGSRETATTTATELATPPQPVPPQPTAAQSIRVTGVAQVGSNYRVIVEVPGETARYVSVGDRIAGGQVLVKRIDFDRLLDPVVILEQFGQEVSKGVGEDAPTQPTGTTETARVPRALNPS